MAHYIGVDIIEIARIQKAIERWGEAFLRRVYTDAELELYRGKPSSSSRPLCLQGGGDEAPGHGEKRHPLAGD